MNFIITLIIGALSGWLSGLVTGKSRTLVMNIFLGLIGGFLANAFNVGGNGFITKIIMSAVFATLFVYIAGIFSKK